MGKTKRTKEASVIEEVEKIEEKEENQTMRKKVMEIKKVEKALFLHRFVAFVLDVIIISLVASLLAYPFLDFDSIDKLSDSSTEVMESYLSQKISIEEYTNESISISYEMARKQGILSLITIFLNILYFVVFQVMHDGQTIGKRLLRIKVRSKDGKNLGMNQMIYRSLIINSIFVDMVSLCILLFTNQISYFYVAGILSMIQFGIIAVSGFMVMFGEKREGIHDLIARTDVVRCDLVKEMEICEN